MTALLVNLAYDPVRPLAARLHMHPHLHKRAPLHQPPAKLCLFHPPPKAGSRSPGHGGDPGVKEYLEGKGRRGVSLLSSTRRVSPLGHRDSLSTGRGRFDTGVTLGKGPIKMLVYYIKTHPQWSVSAQQGGDRPGAARTRRTGSTQGTRRGTPFGRPCVSPDVAESDAESPLLPPPRVPNP